jgi:hypothetical protein
MNETQIILTGNEGELLHSLARQTGKTEEEVVREALGLYKERLTTSGQDRLAQLRKAKGIWKARVDLPDFVELRKEMDRCHSTMTMEGTSND